MTPQLLKLPRQRQQRRRRRPRAVARALGQLPQPGNENAGRPGERNGSGSTKLCAVNRGPQVCAVGKLQGTQMAQALWVLAAGGGEACGGRGSAARVFLLVREAMGRRGATGGGRTASLGLCFPPSFVSRGKVLAATSGRAASPCRPTEKRETTHKAAAAVPVPLPTPPVLLHRRHYRHRRRPTSTPNPLRLRPRSPEACEPSDGASPVTTAPARERQPRRTLALRPDR